MKLIIDVPEEIYKASQIIDVKYEDTIQIPFEVVANGIPLDQTIAEIEENISYNYKMNYKGIASGLLLALNIIDKY